MWVSSPLVLVSFVDTTDKIIRDLIQEGKTNEVGRMPESWGEEVYREAGGSIYPVVLWKRRSHVDIDIFALGADLDKRAFKIVKNGPGARTWKY